MHYSRRAQLKRWEGLAVIVIAMATLPLESMILSGIIDRRD